MHSKVSAAHAAKIVLKRRTLDYVVRLVMFEQVTTIYECFIGSRRETVNVSQFYTSLNVHVTETVLK